MKRSALKPGLPLQRKTPMKASSVPMKRASKPMRQRSKTNARRPDHGEKDLCRNQPCYLQIPGYCGTWPGDVVPAHSNQQRDGKGMGLKAHHEKTVPSCPACHYQCDQGTVFTKAEKFEFWDVAYARWVPVRNQLMSENVLLFELI